MNRFNDFDSTLDRQHPEEREREDDEKLCRTPAQDLPSCIKQFNATFGRAFEINEDYPRVALDNMGMFCAGMGEVHLARMFARHALCAKELI